jgi:RHS repeat-associated protein
VYRYAFQGQELDRETGMEAFQLRLWDGRIGRWLSPDPKGQNHSPYMGMGNNPVRMIDPDGGWCYDSNGNSIPCGDDLSQYQNIWNHTTVLSEVPVTNQNYFYESGPSSSYENGSFSASVNSAKFDYTNSILKIFGQGTFNELNAYNNTNRGGHLSGPLALDFGANYSLLKGSATIQVGNKNFNTSDTVSGCIGCLDGNISTGLFVGEGGKYGFLNEYNAGAYTAKYDYSVAGTLLGVKYTYTTGESVLSAHIGNSKGIYYDNTTGNIVLKGGFHFGFGVGINKDASLEIPAKSIYNYFTK